MENTPPTTNLTCHELELLNIIRYSKDPEKVIGFISEIIMDYLNNDMSREEF